MGGTIVLSLYQEICIPSAAPVLVDSRLIENKSNYRPGGTFSNQVGTSLTVGIIYLPDWNRVDVSV